MRIPKFNYCQHRVKLIASFSQFTKVLADFLSVFYLLTLELKIRNKSYTNTLYIIMKKPKSLLIIISSVLLIGILYWNFNVQIKGYLLSKHAIFWKKNIEFTLLTSPYHSKRVSLIVKKKFPNYNINIITSDMLDMKQLSKIKIISYEYLSIIYNYFKGNI